MMSTIVLIEEDALMRELLVEWLNADGHLVSAVASSELQAPPDPDLVIVNVRRPRHEGAEALRAVKAAHPATPLIAISAQFRQGLAGSCGTADALGVRQVIAKPFTRHDLLAAVHRAIGAAG